MKKTFPAALVLVACAAAGLAGAQSPAALSDWPHVDSAVQADPALEARVQQIVAGMSLEQKVGQMTQPEIQAITPAQVRQYYIGSVLNGGGSWPGKDKHATPAEWVKLAQAYHDASMSTDMKVPIPVIWGIDAVHGNSNVYGATLFPHNIGLGAAHDPQLVKRIAHATAVSTRATGIDWVFAPTLAVAQNPRWGRTYESFSSDPALVRAYARAYVEGMQGDLHGPDAAMATAKHFIGDGATDDGKDQGNATVPKSEMVNVHGAGYYGALAAGVQTVMASYSSWNDTAAGVDYGKMHGAQPLLTGALKQAMGFDGLVVSDYNGIGQVPGCTVDHCPQAVNAGIDLFMVPNDWQAFIRNTVQDVKEGRIPMARIDDAVSRILRVKLRAGLFDRAPADGPYAGRPEALLHRDLARQAVRESLVLLKNEQAALPIKPGARVLVVGDSADNLSNQVGGWSLTWQGTENGNADFPNADSVLTGLRAALGAEHVQYSADGKGVRPGSFDLVVAVIGETPYAEMNGDILASDTLSHSRRFPRDLAALEAAAATGKPVVTVLFSGRPVYANDLLNLSDAFVAAWLPGSEGKGVADLLVAGAGGRPAHDFRGTLGFPWPKLACPAPLDHPDPRKPDLFALGYGLSYARPGRLGKLPEDRTEACGAATRVAVFNLADAAPYALHVGAGGQSQALGGDLNRVLEWPAGQPAVRVSTVQVNTQQDAKQVDWLAPARFYSAAEAVGNFNAVARADAALQFDVVVRHRPASPVRLQFGCARGGACAPAFDLTSALAALEIGKKAAVKVPLACFAGVDTGAVDMPFSVSADAPFSAAFTRIAVVAGAARDADALKCAAAL
ncbi:MAG: glycoside hydrolase family 3 N-terminal domain-containing protein [Pseudoxanthomonas sp.]